MFGLGGKLDGPSISDWKLVYVDYENDVLLVEDDPWEYVSLSLSLTLTFSLSLARSHSPQITAQWYRKFVSCVRCIRILSPSEVQQMSEEGLQILSSSSPQTDQ
ncbi:hypothetical protein FCM35_KLT00654 [Carex littledalei]|uniref:Auxin-responsive protein n=1 Tax=Carex littledalei TaxID=544730 RepID=A0A833RN79_9POAL|nr:hypothetical protein FCM35_KLT00654 [Carex littledalei]